MIFLLKPRIFSYFGLNAKVKDTFKDVDGKGLKERFSESLGEDYDEQLGPLIDLFLDSTIVPQTILPRMIPHMEDMLGNPVVITNDVAMRRRILRFAQHIYNIRSTRLSYEILFSMLGFDTVIVTEYSDVSGFDSDITFDDEYRTFDGDNACTFYSIALTGTISITPEILLAIGRIIVFLEPINAHLRLITYNGIEIGIFEYFDDWFDDYFS